MNKDHWILLGGWFLFASLHSLMAAECFRKACRNAMGRWFIYYRLLYSLFAFLTMGAVLAWQFMIISIDLGPFPTGKWLAGLAALLLGIFLMSVSIRKYFFNLSGLAVFWGRKAGELPRPGEKETGDRKRMQISEEVKMQDLGEVKMQDLGEVEVLELGGLHRYVRHPLYLGTLLSVWGLFLFFPLLSNLLACIMITLYTLLGIRLEEKKLLLQFGETYASYRRKVP